MAQGTCVRALAFPGVVDRQALLRYSSKEGMAAQLQGGLLTDGLQLKAPLEQTEGLK